MPQCLLVPHLPYPAAFYDVHGKAEKNVAGHQAKWIFVLGLVLKHDKHDETKG